MKYITYFFIFLLLPSSLYSISKDSKKPSKLKYYTTHIATGGAAQLAFVASNLLGYVGSIATIDLDISTQIGRKTGFVAPDRSCTNYWLGFFIGILPLLACLTAGSYFVYKTPQWTDTYLLKSDKKRTTRQNIITLLNRICLPYPLGIITGELGIEKDLAIE